MNSEYPIHKNAKTSFIVVGVLLCLLCFTIPVAIWVFIRLGKMKVTLRGDGLEAVGAFLTDTVSWDDVERFGVLHVPVVAGGLGGYFARMKLNHMNEGLNVVFRLKNGKDVKFIANQYDGWEKMFDDIAGRVRAPREEMQMGLLSWKWPERR
ncbi:MAG: hypothetical protein ACO1OB_15780 [Archangium sp.]